MEKSVLWSLRLGFSNKQSNSIESKGIEKFLKDSFAAGFSKETPSCLNDSPKKISDIRELRKQYRDKSDEEKRKLIKTTLIDALE